MYSTIGTPSTKEMAEEGLTWYLQQYVFPVEYVYTATLPDSLNCQLRLEYVPNTAEPSHIQL